jgi:hypothetical protein
MAITIEWESRLGPVGMPLRPWPISIATLKHRTLDPVAERFIECAREVATSVNPA